MARTSGQQGAGAWRQLGVQEVDASPARERLRRVTPFALAALFALATIPLPPSPVDAKAYPVAALVLLVAAVAWVLAPRSARGEASVLLALLFLLGVALLRDGEGGTRSGLGPLVMLPVFWVALYRSRAELAAVVAGVGAVFLAPAIVVGAPAYPDTEYTRGVVWLLVSGVGGFVVHGLVARWRLSSTAEREARLAKEEFVALISHDLRNPLAAITAASELLGENTQALSERDRRLALMIGREAARTTRLVDDLLLMSRLAADRLALRREPVDVVQLLGRRIEAARTRAVAREVEVSLRGVPLPAQLLDADRIADAVDNLLANAIKFTRPGGRVEVAVRRKGPSLLIEVSDTGDGVSEPERKRVFDRFYRGSAGERAGQGAGLGLAIVEAIAEAHGGSASLTSRPNEGTVVTMALPLDRGGGGD
ncbi:MAG TPA: HAMP domain-containing sensor histidine kinase [Solirubrobacteraceae bacterium]|nr:HAMP domain-containing sensor histidine kinase [Solirubrobacteraceae bacterium]